MTHAEWVDEMVQDLMGDIPPDFVEVVVLDERLRLAFLGFKQAVLEGLEGGKPPSVLREDLRTHKTGIMAILPTHHFRIEKLLAKAIENAVARAEGK